MRPSKPVNVFDATRIGIDFVDASRPEPTDTRPGTPERMAVLKRRMELGQELWHPDDATCLPSQADEMTHGMRVDERTWNDWRRGVVDGDDGEEI